MTTMFVVKRHSDNLYSPRRPRYPWVSREKAHVFKRKCDVTQAMNRCKYKPSSYEIISLDLVDRSLIPAVQHVEETIVGQVGSPPAIAPQRKYKVSLVRKDTPYFPGWEDKAFFTKGQADRYVQLMVKKYHYHADYFKVTETDEQALIADALRPEWQDYFLGLAFVVSQRSHDLQTQHGSVIVNRDNRILGVGYNGFPHGLDDSDLPRTRPLKYDWMIHSEINAMANCTERPEGGTIYITGRPCNPCLMQLHQNGIKNIFYGGKYCWAKDDDYSAQIYDRFIKMSGINVTYVEPDLSWISRLAEKLDNRLKQVSPTS